MTPTPRARCIILRPPPARCIILRPTAPTRAGWPTNRSAVLLQVHHLRVHAEFGGVPQHRVDVGVDPLDDFTSRRVTGRERGTHLVEPLVPMVDVVVDDGERLLHHRSMAGEKLPGYYPLGEAPVPIW